MLEKKYVVLKKFGTLKKGKIFDPAVDFEGTEEDVVEAIQMGFIKEQEEGPAPEPKKGKKSSVVVTWRGGTREYSEEVHGEDFMELAESFAKKFNGIIE